MSVVIITGDHPRHLYFANELCNSGKVCGIIYEKRAPFIQTADDFGVLDSHLASLTNHHFKARAEAEEHFFGTCSKVSSIPTLTVEQSELNSDKVIAFLQAQKPSLVLSYGCHKLSAELMASVAPCRFWNTHGGFSPDYRGVATHFWPSYMLLVLSYGCHKLSAELMASVAPCRFWNTHGGFSPDYRGVATHFWPSYMLEVEMTGMTLHETTDFIDGGSVIYQTGYDLTKDDTLHMVAGRTVQFYTEVEMTGMTLHETTDFIDGGSVIYQTGYDLTKDDTLHMVAGRTVQFYTKKLVSFLQDLDYNHLPQGIVQKSSGKVWMSNDWRPEHLRLIYDFYQDNIVNLTINGELKGRKPKLVNALSEQIKI